MSQQIRVQRALVSVWDKSGLEPFVQGLQALGVEILSTGGTARAIREAGVKVTDVDQVTGFPEILDGRVKTLHPAIHGGLLARRDDVEHMKTIAEHNIETIDLVCVNLYPFEETVSGGADLKTAAENIDIGGPSMIRSAAKAALLYDSVLIVTEPTQYLEVIKTLKENQGDLTTELRMRYAIKAFSRTKAYDSAIVSYLEEM